MLTDDYDPLKGRMLQVLDMHGKVVVPELEPVIEDGTLKGAYRTMVLARVTDEKAVILQRQGRMGAYPPNRGQEAASLGPAMALRDDDWLVWAFRELTGLLWKGLPLINYFLYWMGNEEGGRIPDGQRITPATVPVASQIPIATGIALASMARNEPVVTLAFCGDGATSEGEFHEGLNAAGVFKAPTVFVIQNNQWAISVPRSRQTAAPTLAQKACAYGFPGILVDGNDILAMYAASKEAVDRARRGEGPTLIEAYTYRLGNHTTSDDARKYRLVSEQQLWEERDPLIRTKSYLVTKGLLDNDEDAVLWDKCREEAEAAVKKAEELPRPTIDEVFAHTYAELTPEQRRQLDSLRKEVK